MSFLDFAFSFLAAFFVFLSIFLAFFLVFLAAFFACFLAFFLDFFCALLAFLFALLAFLTAFLILFLAPPFLHLLHGDFDLGPILDFLMFKTAAAIAFLDDFTNFFRSSLLFILLTTPEISVTAGTRLRLTTTLAFCAFSRATRV